jgi:hypothetical protein
MAGEQPRPAAGQAWRQVRCLPRWRNNRRMGRQDSHECEHEVVADAISTGSHARLLLLVHLAGAHDLDCTGDEDLPALEALHERCHGSRASGGSPGRSAGG